MTVGAGGRFLRLTRSFTGASAVGIEADRGEPDGHLGQRFGTDRTVQVPDRLVHAVPDHAEREQPLELRSQFLEDRPRSVGHAPLPGVLLVGVLMAAVGRV